MQGAKTSLRTHENPLACHHDGNSGRAVCIHLEQNFRAPGSKLRMHEERASSTSGECATDGADTAFQTSHSSSSNSDGSCDPIRDGEQNAPREGRPREVPPEATKAGMGDGDTFAVEGSEAVRLLDEELEELEKLMVFQRKKIDALGRLRRQWLTGERSLPDVPLGGYREAYLADAASAAPAAVLDEERRAGVPDRGRGRGDAFPAAAAAVGRFEHYMMPYVRFPFTGPVVAMKMLSFRLKGGSRSPGSKRGGGGGDRSGFLNVFASLHADGMVRVRDSDGEEILAFDSGHEHGHAIAPPPLDPAASSSATPTTTAATVEPPETNAAATTATMTATTAAMAPPAIGLTGDSSEGDPVLVTAGADGTVRVHALTVRFRGKRVAGGRGGKGNKPLGGGGGGGGGAGSRRHEQQQQQQQQQQQEQVPSTAENAPEMSAGDPEDDGKTRSKKGYITGDARGGSRDRPLGPPPATARGVEMTARFRVCLGSECGRGPQDERTVNAAANGDTGVGPDDEGAQSLPGGEEDMAAVTSMDAYFHRALATTVVVAGYSAGGVRLFHGGNGTVLGSAEADGEVLAVKRSGQTVAYSDGQDVRFASAAKLHRTVDRVCRGGWGTSGGVGGGGGGSGGDEAAVTALAFDAVSPEILYVGSETGEVMAFNSKVPEAGRSNRCLPANRLPPPPPQLTPSHAGSAASGAALDGYASTATEQAADISGGGGGGVSSPRVRCDAISAVRGYAIVSQGPLLLVYNTTGDTRLLFSRQHVSEEGESDRAGVDAAGNEWGVKGSFPIASPKWFVMPSSGGDVLVAEAARFGAEMSVYKGTLPHERHGPDMGWMRVPVIILGLFVVAITQVYSRRKATSFVGKTRKPGRNWREDDDDDGDGVGDMSPGNDNDEDFGIDSDIAGGLGRRLGLGLDGGTGGRQDWGRLMSDRSRREDSPPRHVAPPSSQRRYNSDLWERESSD